MTMFPRRPKSGTSRDFWDNCERLMYLSRRFIPRNHVQRPELSLAAKWTNMSLTALQAIKTSKTKM